MKGLKQKKTGWLIVLAFLIAAALIVVILTGSGKETGNRNGIETYAVPKEKGETLFCKKELHNGDAKFLGDKIVTTLGCLKIFDQNGNLLGNYEDIRANWIGVYAGENLIVYSSAEGQTGIVKLDSDGKIIFQTSLWENGPFCIDPSIIKNKEGYFLTVTQIDGTVNNADASVPNGIYTIKLYHSQNLSDWEFVTDIRSMQNNLEDVRLYENKGHLYLLYEKEELDRGNSSIYLCSSEDGTGRGSWKWETELCPPTADQEPASLVWEKKGISLYYSSDERHPGKTYEGMELYRAGYDQEYKPKGKKRISTKSRKGKLLFDQRREKGWNYFLFQENYLTESNLVLERERE